MEMILLFLLVLILLTISKKDVLFTHDQKTAHSFWLAIYSHIFAKYDIRPYKYFIHISQILSNGRHKSLVQSDISLVWCPILYSFLLFIYTLARVCKPLSNVYVFRSVVLETELAYGYIVNYSFYFNFKYRRTYFENKLYTNRLLTTYHNKFNPSGALS